MCVGLDCIVGRLEILKSEYKSYKNFRRKLPDFLIKIDEGNGESYITELISETYKDNDLRNFTGKSICLEYKLDGSYSQIEEIFNDIDNMCCYGNEYEGVIAINITSLVDYFNREQFDLFIENVKKYSEISSFILFINPKSAKDDVRFYDKIVKELGWFEQYNVDRYSNSDFVDIVLERLESMDITITSEEALSKVLSAMIEKSKVQVCRDIKIVIDDVIRNVDYDMYTPEINSTSIKKLEIKYKVG